MLMSFPSRWAHRLEGDMFPVTVNDILSRSRESLESEGYDITGYDQIDHARRNMTTVSVVPIVDGTGRITGIIDYYRMGLQMGFQSVKDIETIVHIIGNYLIEWKDQLDTMINVDVRPYEKFIADLTSLHSFLFAYLPDSSFLHAEAEVKRSAPIGLRRPFGAKTSSEKEEFYRPTYEDTFGSITKTVRDRIINDRGR